MIFWFIPPLVIRYRKKRAKNKGIEYKPFLPKTTNWVKSKIKTNGEVEREVRR